MLIGAATALLELSPLGSGGIDPSASPSGSKSFLDVEETTPENGSGRLLAGTVTPENSAQSSDEGS